MLSGKIVPDERYDQRRWCLNCGSLWDQYWTRAGRFSVRAKWNAPRLVSWMRRERRIARTPNRKRSIDSSFIAGML